MRYFEFVNLKKDLREKIPIIGYLNYFGSIFVSTYMPYSTTL